MKLPQRILSQVEWFEVDTKKDYWQSTIYTVITLHFHAWWRWSRVIKMAGIYDRTEVDGTRIYHPTDETQELLAQLKEHCKL